MFLVVLQRVTRSRASTTAHTGLSGPPICIRYTRQIKDEWSEQPAWKNLTACAKYVDRLTYCGLDRRLWSVNVINLRQEATETTVAALCRVAIASSRGRFIAVKCEDPA